MKEKPSAFLSWYVVILLALSNSISAFDRGLVALVIDPIKHTLHITDTEIGIMIGPAFILFYSTVSLPIGRLADGHNRKRIILAGMVFWSLCTGLFGLAKNFLVLGGARMGVGFGEASLVPAGVSIISDLFPREKMGRAVGTFTAGNILGASLASILGGWLVVRLTKIGPINYPVLGVLVPWESAFVIISVPGLVLGLIIALTMREPVRRNQVAQDQGPSLFETLTYVWSRKASTLALILGFACISTQSGTATWLTTHYIRTFHLTPAQVGLPLGMITLLAGIPSAVIGGYLADRLRRRGREDANILVAMVALIVMLPLNLLLPNLPNFYWSIGLQAPAMVAACLAYGVAHPGVSLAVPQRMRAQAVALYLLAANSLGIGVIPLLIPIITDYVFHDPLAVRYGITIITAIFMPLGIGLLLIARKPFIAHVKDLNPSDPDEMTHSVPVAAAALLGDEAPAMIGSR